MSIVEKMNLYAGENVVIKDKNNQEFEGKIVDVEKPDDNEYGEFVIYFTAISGECLCLLEHEISSLELKS